MPDEPPPDGADEGTDVDAGVEGDGVDGSVVDGTDGGTVDGTLVDGFCGGPEGPCAAAVPAGSVAVTSATAVTTSAATCRPPRRRTMEPRRGAPPRSGVERGVESAMILGGTTCSTGPAATTLEADPAPPLSRARGVATVSGVPSVSPLDALSFIAVSALTIGVGMMLWFLAEYLLHRFAMHHLDGRGIMSREHLEHHVHSSWSFDVTHLLSWTGVAVVGAILWFPVGWLLVSATTGVLLAVGWALGYAFYEFHHARCHLAPPRGRYGRWVRRHHFQHHFGAPMSNHGVSMPLWDIVFRTRRVPDRIRVPRRLALPWMVGADGELLPEFTDDYELVGREVLDERQAGIDRARAFASLPPTE